MIDHLLLRIYFIRRLLVDRHLRKRIRKIMRSQIPRDDSRNHPKEHKSMSGHHITMLSRYIIASDMVTGKKVLDTGCGFGWGSYILSLKAEEVLGIDINENSISYAASNWEAKNLSFGICSVLDLGKFQSDVVDVVTSMELIEHFTWADGLKYFREIFRVLKHGGVLFGSSSFGDGNTKKRLMTNDPEHKYIYSEDELKRILEDIGFMDVEMTKGWLFKARK